MQECLCAPPGGESENPPEKAKRKEGRSKENKQTKPETEESLIVHSRYFLFMYLVNVGIERSSNGYPGIFLSLNIIELR